MSSEDDGMNEHGNDDRHVRDNKRRWQVTREVPLSLIYSVCGLLVAIGIGYQSIKGDITKQAEGQVSLARALSETTIELRNLTKQFQEGSVPSAQNAWKIQQNEAAWLELKARVAEGERLDGARESRLQRLENSMGTTNARIRAREER